jgi:hypothetical protein
MTAAQKPFYSGGRRTDADNPGPFAPKVVRDEKDLLDLLNRRRVQLRWSSRRLDEEVGRKINLTTMIRRDVGSKTTSVLDLADAMGLEIHIRVKPSKTRLERAIAARKRQNPSAHTPEGVPGE